MGNSFQLLYTKLIIPPLPVNLVQRQTLFNKINSDQLAKLILVCAPAGYGKSTLINSWVYTIKNAGDPADGIAWFSIDLQDNIPALFFSYLIKAIQQIDGQVGQNAQSLLNFPKIPVESMITSLINDLTLVEQRVKIVLDDYHYITDETIHHALNYLIDHLPSNVQLVVISREAPPIPLHRLRVYHHMIEIDQHDLRFSLGEAISFLKDFMGLTLSLEYIQSILKHTEGWVAGMQIAALSIKSRIQHGSSRIINFPKFFDNNPTTREYFYQEVLNQQSEGLRSFYLKTCVLDRLSGPLCNALVGIDNSADILEQMRQTNSFLTVLDETGQWYRYHSLFANFLLSQVEKEEVTSLQIQASRWHEANGMVMDAIRYSLSAGDMDAACRMLTDIMPELISRGEILQLLDWLKALPARMILENAYLSTIMGWMLYHNGKSTQSEPYLRAAEQKMADTLSPFHQWFYLLVSVEILDSKGKFTTAMEHARQALDMARQIGLSDCSSLEIYSETLRLTGSYEAAIQSFRQSLQLSREQNNALMEAFSVFHLANTLYQQGQYNAALLVCEEFAGQMTDETGALHPLAGYGLIPMGQLYYELNQLDQAAYCIENGNRLVRELGMLKPVIQSAILQARLAFLNGDMDGTCKHLFFALDTADSLNHLEYNLLVAAESAELELRMGNQAACERWLRSVQVDLDNSTDPLHEPLILVYARLLIAKAEYQKAGNVLQQLEEAAQSHHRVGVLIKIFILQARNSQLSGNFPQAFQCLEKAVLLAAPINHVRSFLDQDSDLLPLLAVIQNAAPTFVDVLIEEFSRSARQATSRISSDFLAQFSERESEIINLLIENRTNKEIAQRLFITVGTTKWYLNNIFRKMMVKNRKEAVSLLEKIDLEKNRNRLT